MIDKAWETDFRKFPAYSLMSGDREQQCNWSGRRLPAGLQRCARQPCCATAAETISTFTE